MEFVGNLQQLQQAILRSPQWYPLKRVFAQPIDLARWDMSQLSPLDSNEFRWDYGVTPLTNWQVVVIAWILYFGSIIVLRIVMSFLPAFKLTQLTAIHNLILTLWSLLMFIFIAIDIIDIAQSNGIEALFCTNDIRVLRGRLFYGIYIYYLSKFYELLDTIIIVLKKKPIIFLHWFHHAIVIAMVWSWLHYGLVFSSLGMLANTLIHVFMYYYYFQTALGQKVWYKKFITSGQIVQFSISFLLTIPFFYYYFNRTGCAGIEALAFSMFCNGSFLLLFIQFYFLNYNAEGDEKKVKKDQ